MVTYTPVLYIEEISADQVIDWRIFIRATVDRTYVVYATRRPNEYPSSIKSGFPFFRMEFYDRKSLANWLSETMSHFENKVNLTMYMFNLDAAISNDFVGFDNLRHGNLEISGYDGTHLTHQRVMKYLRILANHRTY